VDDLSRKLRGDPDYKVRLSAALNLGKLGDPRAVGALVDGLGDRDRTVRSVAAAALGKLVSARVPADLRARAAGGLERAAREDRDDMVRQEAARSLAAIRALEPPGPPPGGGRSIYVDVGPMTDNTKSSPGVTGVMRKQVLDSLGKHSPKYLLTWPTGRAPSETELKRKGTPGFYVDGSLVTRSVSAGSPRTVSCTVSLLIATYPGKSLFGFMRGGAEVSVGLGGDRAVAEATVDCVGAVLDDLVATRLVPTIHARAP
jgi:hypothetical protein